MALMQMTAESLSKDLGEVVPELYVTVAKNSISGLDSDAIAELLGATVDEIREIESEALYKAVRLTLGAAHANESVETDFNWDGIEHQALKNLTKRVEFEKDTDTLLRIAAVANKAVRRTRQAQQGILDATAAGGTVKLKLTQRLVHKLEGGDTQETTRSISVVNGTAKNPGFEDIDKLLGVSQRPPSLPQNVKIHTHEADFGLEDIPGLNP